MLTLRTNPEEAKVINVLDLSEPSSDMSISDYESRREIVEREEEKRVDMDTDEEEIKDREWEREWQIMDMDGMERREEEVKGTDKREGIIYRNIGW